MESILLSVSMIYHYTMFYGFIKDKFAEEENNHRVPINPLMAKTEFLSPSGYHPTSPDLWKPLKSDVKVGARFLFC